MKRISVLFTMIAGISLFLSAQTNSYEIKIGEFNKINLLDNVDVIYRCTGDDNPENIKSGTIRFDADYEFADAFEFTNKKGELKIKVTEEKRNSDKLPALYLYSDFLSEVENSSEATLTVESIAPCAEFKAKLTGNGSIVTEGLRASRCNASIDTGCGTIVLSGSVRNAVFRLIGTGTIQADRLEAAEVECKAVGSGSIGCWPIDILKAKIIGSTKIYYKGSPAEMKKSGGGSLIQMD